MGKQLPSDFYRVPEVVHTTYNMGTWDLPDIYARTLGPAALGLGHIIYQANQSCPCYNYYIILQNRLMYNFSGIEIINKLNCLSIARASSCHKSLDTHTLHS